MKLFGRLLHNLYLIYFKWKNGHYKSVKFSKGCIVSEDNFFEGNNFIGGRIHNSYVGYGTYIVGESGYVNDCKIGKFCSIASNCHIGLGNHPLDMVSTSPLFSSSHTLLPQPLMIQSIPVEEKSIEDTRYKVVIGNDVWLGYNVCVKEGVTIGDGAVIGAKALVTKDIPPYAIAVGIPARVVKYRFTDEEIQKLLATKWWDKDLKWIQNNICSFQNINAFLDIL